MLESAPLPAALCWCEDKEVPMRRLDPDEPFVEAVVETALEFLDA